MIGQYKKGDSTAYYFKAYHGLDPLTGKKIVTFRRGFKTEREARLAEAKCLTEYEKKTFRNLGKPLVKSISDLFRDWVNRYLFLIATFTFEAYNAFYFSVKSVISTTTYVSSWVDFCTTLAVKDRTT